jgi:hypothetical protein
MTVHGMFEFGVATIIAPLSMNEAVPSEREMQLISEIGPTAWFKRAAREIAVLDMYDRYRRRGWSTKLVYDVRHKLGPTIVQTLCLVWYAAIVEAGLIKPPKKQPQSAQLKKKQQS